jgi:branched-chain amino acid transport system permease protein
VAVLQLHADVQALRATAVNRLGARLVGIRTTLSESDRLPAGVRDRRNFGILIVPITTLYYDTGFLIGLKGLSPRSSVAW